MGAVVSIPKYDVFISYRRLGGSENAELVKGELIRRGYRESRIFLDTRSLSTGNYRTSIDDALTQSQNVVVIISKGCFDNLQEDSNWTMEISRALSLGINIVPIYFDEIRSIDVDQLPSSIRGLSFENAVLYVHEYADASFSRLEERLVRQKRPMPKWAKWVAAAVASSGLAYGAYTAVDNTTELNTGEVYVVNSSSSQCYHIDKNCVTLKNATHKLIKVSKEEAVEMGKRPCKKCCK